MNKAVAIVAGGGTPFSKNNNMKIADIMFDAVRDLFERTPAANKKDVDAVLVSTNDNTKYLGAILSERIAIRPKISHNIESMCSSGTNAIVSAYAYIASGLANAVLVVGADRFDCPGQILEWDESRGEFTHPMFWASLFSRAYKTSFDVSADDLAAIAAKNHRNAQDNPNAISDKTYSIDEVLHSRQLTDDLNLLECSRPSTGGSAVLLTSDKLALRITDTPVWITGIGQKTMSAGFTKSDNYTCISSTVDSARQAFEMANIKAEQVDVAEVHDAFAVCEALAVEDIGLVQKGGGAGFLRKLYDTKSKMINPRGGLIGSGHPLGATGVAQAVEIFQQLQNKAERRQVCNPTIGLVHNMSAAATSSTVLVMSN